MMAAIHRYLYPGTEVPFRFDGEGVVLRNQALCVWQDVMVLGSGTGSLIPDKAGGGSL
jgi:hypothetical protein